MCKKENGVFSPDPPEPEEAFTPLWYEIASNQMGEMSEQPDWYEELQTIKKAFAMVIELLRSPVAPGGYRYLADSEKELLKKLKRG